MLQPGYSSTSEYTSWREMHKRCAGKGDPKNLPYYKDKNIKVCKRWNSFEKFLADLGMKPHPSFTLDRIDNNGNYCKSNCRWASKQEQVVNRGSQRNNTSGCSGVSWDKSTCKWRVRFCGDHLGLFCCLEDAKMVYNRAKKNYLKLMGSL